MRILYSIKFKKYFTQRIRKNSTLEKRFQERIAVFIKDRKNPILKDHKLTGELKSFRAFSIKGDCRVIYKEEDEETILLINIGTHNQVYA